MLPLPYMEPFIILAVVIGLIVFLVINRRNRMLKLWQDVSRHELLFHKQLFETAHAYVERSDLFEQIENHDTLLKVSGFEEDNLRTLTLEERQAVFKSLQMLYVSMDEETIQSAPELKKKFEDLQNLRLKYNSKVLYYNHFILAFPMRILSKRIGFEEKEYFG